MVILPLVVQIHPQICLCERKHKWSPDAIIASLEYNWPQLQGTPGFSTPTQCQEASGSSSRPIVTTKTLYAFVPRFFVLPLPIGVQDGTSSSMSIVTMS